MNSFPSEKKTHTVTRNIKNWFLKRRKRLGLLCDVYVDLRRKVEKILRDNLNPTCDILSVSRRPHRIVILGSNRSGKTSIMYRWKVGVFIPTVPTFGLLKEDFTWNLPLNDAGRYKIHCTEIGRDPQSIEAAGCQLSVQKEHDMSQHTAISNYLSRICCCCSVSARNGWMKRQQRPLSNDNLISYKFESWVRIASKTDTVVYVVDSSCKIALLEMFDWLTFVLYDDVTSRRGTRVLVLANKQDVWGAVAVKDIERMLSVFARQKEGCRVIGCSALTGLNLDLALAWALRGDEPILTDRTDCSGVGIIGEGDYYC